MKNRRNKFDRRGSSEMGRKAEDRFKNIAKKRGWKMIRSTYHQDTNEHWDFQIDKGDKSFKVDVKSRKKLKRKNAEVQDEWTWIELKGVKDEGWLYGKADLIAFEKKNSFIIVRRLDLIGLVTEKVDVDTEVDNSEEAMYKVYSREKRFDKLSLIEIKYLEQIKWDEWKEV